MQTVEWTSQYSANIVSWNTPSEDPKYNANESHQNASSHFNGICHIEFAELRDTCMDFHSFGK